MAIKRLSTRIVNKHATAESWNNSTFIPLQGEIIIYDPGYDSIEDKTYTRERIKVGDGTHTVKDLPYANELDVTTNKTVKTATVVTSVGTPLYTSASYVAPTMTQLCEEDVLTINFNAGSYTPAEFVAGEVARSTELTYVEDVNVTAETPI